MTTVVPASPKATPLSFSVISRRASSRSFVTRTPLPAASPSVLMTYGGFMVARKLERRHLDLRNAPYCAVGYARDREELLHVGLRALRSCAPSYPGTDDHFALRAKPVRETVHQRRLGSDDEEVGLELRCRRGHTRDAVCRDAVIARSDDDVRALRQNVRERVFSRAGSDDDAARHAVRTNCSRSGPTPTTEIVTPIFSSRNRT